ncbi:MAG TPA: hypothetical protein DD658_04145 [Deltaproteobacteria bacterium]|nr:hypothetical protein [Deltaproteobacteria bacterium]
MRGVGCDWLSAAGPGAGDSGIGASPCVAGAAGGGPAEGVPASGEVGVCTAGGDCTSVEVGVCTAGGDCPAGGDSSAARAPEVISQRAAAARTIFRIALSLLIGFRT